MAVPQGLSEFKSGRRRSYKNKFPKNKSFQVFKNWDYDSLGNRGKPKVSSNRLAKYNADLCSTYYENISGSSVTVHGLGFDIDLDRTSQKWLDGTGSVSWPKIGSFLAETETPILSFISTVASSTSGKGLGIYLPISPLQIAPSTAKAQSSARTLQAHIITILNSHGIGADPGAMGLIRDIPNYLNPAKRIDSDLLVIKRTVDNRRYPVVSELLRYTNKHPAIRRLKSEDPKRLFTGHRTSEVKLAHFYQYLLYEGLEGSIWMTGPEVAAISNLSKATLYKFLLSKHEWIDITFHGKGEGYELVFKPTEGHSERTFELLNKLDWQADSDSVLVFDRVIPPESVEDGDRNDYLSNCVVELKVKGVNLEAALKAMEHIARRIPGASTSRNCKSVASIVRSIYRNRPQTFGTDHRPLSQILLDGVNRLGGNVSKEFPKKSKKGTTYGSFQPDVLARALDLSQSTELCSMDVSQRDENLLAQSQGEPARAGDLPPSSAESPKVATAKKDAAVLDFLAAIVPAAEKSLCGRKTAQIIHQPCRPEPQTEPPASELVDLKAQAFITLKALRAHEFENKNPLDHYDMALKRLIGRASFEEIAKTLWELEPDIRNLARVGKLYFHPRGSIFRRIANSYSRLPEHLRKKLIKELLGST